MDPETLNLKAGHTDYDLSKNVGNVIWYHGAAVDLRAVKPAVAERIAKDPSARWLTHTATRKANEAKALLESFNAKRAEEQQQAPPAGEEKASQETAGAGRGRRNRS